MRVRSTIRGLGITLALLAGCTGRLVNVAPVPPASYSEGERTSSQACGMLLFTFIPVSLNDRVERAYAEALDKANATSLTDTSLIESWQFTPFGPRVCTSVSGIAITRSAGAEPPAAPRVEFKKKNSR